MLLNAEKIVVLTHDAQPPPFLATEQRTETYNLAAMLTAAGTQLKHIHLEYHLQQTFFIFAQTGRFYWTEVFALPQAFNIFFPLAPFFCKVSLNIFPPIMVSGGQI